MTAFYWLVLGHSPDCDPNARLEKGLYRSKQYLSAANYFRGLDGSPGNWTMHYDKQPCDISNGAFHLVVSQSFKDIADSLSIDTEYHPVTAIIGGKTSNDKYYLPKPPIIDFLDKESESVDVIPDDEQPSPGWIVGIRRTEATVYASKLNGIHWARQSKMFGDSWIISEEFKKKLDSGKITAPRKVKANVVSE